MIKIIFAILLSAYALFGQIIGSEFIKIDQNTLSVTDESKFAAYLKSLDDPSIIAKYRETMTPVDLLSHEDTTLTNVSSYEGAFKNLRIIYSRLYLKEKSENIDAIAADIKAKQARIISVLLASQSKNLYDADVIPIIFEYRKLDRELLKLSVQRESLIKTKTALIETIVKKKLSFESDDGELGTKIKATQTQIDALKAEAKKSKDTTLVERIAIKSSIASIQLKNYEAKSDFFEKIRLIKKIKSSKDSAEDIKKLESLLGKKYEPIAFDKSQVSSKNKDIFAEYQKQKDTFDAAMSESKFDLQVFEVVFKSFDESLPAKTTGVLENLYQDTKELLGFPLFVVNNSDIKIQTILSVLLAVTFVYLAKTWLNIKFIPSHFRDSNNDDGHSQHIQFVVSKIITFSAYFLIIFVILSGFGLNLTNFAIIVSAMSVGIGFGLQGVISNFVSGVILLFENSIKIGDILSLPNGQTGVVTSVNLRTTNIKTGDDVTILIPNSTVFTGQIENLTKDSPSIRKKVKFAVGYQTDMAKLKEIPDIEALRLMPESAPLSSHLSVAGYGNYGIEIEYRVFVDIKKYPLDSSDFLKEFLEALKQNNIELPYPKLEIIKFEGNKQ